MKAWSILTSDNASAQQSCVGRPHQYSKIPIRRQNGLGLERQTMRPFLLMSAIIILTAPMASSQNTWRSQKNIFGGQDYDGPNGQRVTSRANIFGGFDYSSANGKRWSSRANIFGGQDYQGPSGQRVTSRANIFGGQDYQGRNDRGSSRANIFGGQDYHGPKGQRSSSRRNIFGGQDYQGRPPYIFGGNK